MLPFGSNIAVLAALRRLNKSVNDLGVSSERLASGQRINRASDDAAGLAIATGLQRDTRVYTQAIRNGNDAISALSIAEGTATNLTSILTRLRELATQAASGTFSRTQRLAIDTESKSLTNEYNRLVGSTTFNGLNLLNGSLGRLNIQLGYGTSGSIGADIGSGLQRNVGTGFSSTSITHPLDGVTDQQLADFNGDGILDLATTNAGTGLQLQLGNGDGTFKASSIVPGKVFSTLAVGDVDRDGITDIVTADNNTGTNRVRVWHGNGDGTFTAYALSTSTSGALGTSVELLDVNNDGILDVVGTGASSAYGAILLGNGDGSFRDGGTFATIKAGSRLRLGDFNGDGRTDLITGSASAGALLIAVNSGSGGFSTGISINSGLSSIADFDVKDVNYDGILDIVAGDGSTNLAILKGLGNGSFSSIGNLSASNGSLSIKLGDIDADGLIDIVVGGNSAITTFKGNGDGSFGSESVYKSNTTPSRSVLIGDLNGDGVSDLVATNTGSAELETFLAQTTISTGIQRIDLTTQEAAKSALASIDQALARVQTELGNIGGAQSRVSFALANLSSLRDNNAAAESRIRDVDVAVEAANLARLSILRQSGAAVLAQANQSPALALALLESLRR